MKNMAKIEKARAAIAAMRELLKPDLKRVSDELQASAERRWERRWEAEQNILADAEEQLRTDGDRNWEYLVAMGHHGYEVPA